MKKVLSLFALCAMFAFTGCSKKEKAEHKPTKKEHMKKEKCSGHEKKPCMDKAKKSKAMKNDKSMKHHGHSKKDNMK
jgi:hypothetical protein